jgi:rfaE bifunctional protein kinase chain/domain
VSDKKKITVFISGNFNVLHPGHLRLFRFAKELGTKLIVGVESDKIAGLHAHVNEAYRLEGIQSNSWVDEVFLMDQPVLDVIKRLRPDIVLKGKEHELNHNPELEIVSRYGGRLVFGSGEVVFSSLDLMRREFQGVNLGQIIAPIDFMNRHGIPRENLVNLINAFKALSVCVVGDMILDEYITCQPLGMSQEDPTIVVTPLDSKKFIGGAGIVAAHAAGLGAKSELITVIGDDAAAQYVENALLEAGVQANLIKDESRPTTLKQRFRAIGKTLLRVSHLHQGAISKSLQERLYGQIISALDRVDVMIFSDFNYGCLPQELVDRAIIAAKKKNVMLLADSQSSSQTGDVSRFNGMKLITPTEREARLAMRDTESGLVVLAERLRQQSGAENIFLKLGAEGLLVHAHNSSENDWITDRVDALNNSPKDVAGAGDSMLVTAALTLAAGGGIWEAACLGSIAAAVQVGRVGNKPMNAEEIITGCN